MPAGYRGHNAPPDHKFKVYTSGQKRRLTPQIKREFKRRTLPLSISVRKPISASKRRSRVSQEQADSQQFDANLVNSGWRRRGEASKPSKAWYKLVERLETRRRILRPPRGAKT